MGVTVPLALLAGVVSFASPCFLPIVPAFVGQLVGTGTQVSRRAALVSALSFVAGFSAVFIALWASIGLVGRSLGPYAVHARIAAGAVLVLMGLHVARILTIAPFDTLVRADGRLRPGQASPVRAGVMGVVFGAGWTPCIGPVLSGILALATMSTTVWSGISLMLAYCLGLGAPIVAVALGSAQVTRRFDWFRRHHVGVSLASGGLLVAVGLLMISGTLGRLSALVQPDL